MRCDEVIHELSAPAGRLDPSALADHLEHCAICGEFAARSNALDRLWDATRPADPAPETVDRAWARLNQALDARADEPAAPMVLPMPTARRALAWLVPIVAAAAAVLLAVLPRLADPGPGPVPNQGQVAQVVPSDPEPPAELAFVEVEMGQITLIHTDSATVEHQPMMSLSDTDTTPPTFTILNYFEGQSSPFDLLSSLP